MSLITCEECQAQISDSAISCPQCGSTKHRKGAVSKKVAAPNARLTVLIIIAGLLAMTIFLPDFSKEKTSSGDHDIADVPSLTENQIVHLNDNEFAELERKCLGMSHKSCAIMESDTVKKQRGFRESLNKARDDQDKLLKNLGLGR